MGLLDKLIDKIFDGAKKKKTDSIVKRLKKANPAFAKAVDKHQRSYEEMMAELEKELKKRELKL